MVEFFILPPSVLHSVFDKFPTLGPDGAILLADGDEVGPVIILSSAEAEFAEAIITSSAVVIKRTADLFIVSSQPRCA